MHCVPKGPEQGDDEGLQLLISFSVLEQFIIHSLNYVQFCCYGLMKILLHVYFDLCSDTQDTISSYHLKTVLFHVLEDVHTDFWIPQNIFYCLRICLTRLLLFVMGGRCSNYFIPESNLFLKTIFTEKKCQIQKKLYEVLLYENAYICFTVSLVIPINAIILRSESHEVRTFDSLCLALTVVNGHHTTYHECIHSILRIMNALQFEKNHRRIAILKYIWLLVMRRIGIILYD